jgi:hypothetical protein
MFMCVVNLKSVNQLDLTWKQSFLIVRVGHLNLINSGEPAYLLKNRLKVE